MTRPAHRTSAIVGLLLAACTAANPGASPTTSQAVSSSGATPSEFSAPSALPSEAPRLEPSVAPGTTSWERTATFESDPLASHVTDLVAWKEGFVAIGSTFQNASIAGAETPSAWVSIDGTAWEARPIDLGVDDASLVGIAPLGAGESLLLIGRTPGGLGSTEAAPPGSFAWTSSDGETWSPVELPLAAGAQVSSFDHGAAGYAMVADGAIWHSADGATWTMTLDEGAGTVIGGDEGFVATLVDAEPGTPQAVASADGITWYEAEPIGRRIGSVAALGGDWLAVALGDDGAIGLSHSTNGLEWTEVLDVNDLTGPDGPKTGRGLEFDSISGAVLAGGAGHAFVTLTGNHCCAQLGWNHGTWTTRDGRTWSPMPSAAVTDDEPFGALVAAVAADDGGAVVLGGYVGRGVGAAFWVGER